MKIAALRIENYRTLETLELTFPSPYSAICGANDSGKTNVVRAIRALMKEESSPAGLPFEDQDELSLKDDYPKWKDAEPNKREIALELLLVLDQQRDAGYYNFVAKQLSLTPTSSSLELKITVRYRTDRAEPAVLVQAEGSDYADLNAQEVLKKLQSSKSILFHNSTQIEPEFFVRGHQAAGYIRDISGQHETLIATMKKSVTRGLAKISKSQQQEFESLLGRLQTKYKVGLSLPAFDFGYMPYRITLGEKKYEVPLDDWGSGTKNRTLILLTLFRARQIGESEPSASKITPVIIVEEPESFLHPSAQAEFGRVLQDLAAEFEVQVIVTTHSPYLLSMQEPGSNILLRRKTAYRQLRDTERVPTTADNWMAPFGQALGLDTEEFKPWKALILSGSEAILLVEGETDCEYFEMLRLEVHGTSRLQVRGEVVSYEGTGSLQNTVLLRFIKNRYRKLFVTFDLDAAERLEKPLQALQLEKGKHYLPVGLNVAGKKNIEGLLPDRVATAVYGAHPGLVQAATAGTKDEQDSAKGRLKRLLLEEFKRQAQPGSEDYGHFYQLARAINRALS
jgi:AAA15 family ATPase/GTPase